MREFIGGSPAPQYILKGVLQAKVTTPGVGYMKKQQW